jgi:hypothetical protein
VVYLPAELPPLGQPAATERWPVPGDHVYEIREVLRLQPGKHGSRSRSCAPQTVDCIAKPLRRAQPDRAPLGPHGGRGHAPGALSSGWSRPDQPKPFVAKVVGTSPGSLSSRRSCSSSETGAAPGVSFIAFSSYIYEKAKGAAKSLGCPRQVGFYLSYATPSFALLTLRRHRPGSQGDPPPVGTTSPK